MEYQYKNKTYEILYNEIQKVYAVRIKTSWFNWHQFEYIENTTGGYRYRAPILSCEKAHEAAKDHINRLFYDKFEECDC